MAHPSPDPSSSPPGWPHCGHGITPEDRVGCRGIHVPGHTACLAHLSDADRNVYLSGLIPGTDVDHRGTPFTEPLLDTLLDALRDPATGHPRLGSAGFESATFEGDAGFRSATFEGDAGFRSATFHGDAGFESTIFQRGAGFEWATFERDAEFRSATFHGDAWFGAATFQRGAGFVSATFHGNVGFKRATFQSEAQFERTTFERDARFRSATFHGGARFWSTAFERDARFEWATFQGDAWFGSATFQGDARFESATFQRGARFERTTFQRDARFESATFHGGAGFGPVTFQGDARFESTTFKSNAGFWSTTFEGDAWFRSATFQGDARFESTTFKSNSQFEWATFQGDAWFGSATFQRDGWFGSATFQGGARFESTTFKSNARFEQAVFERSTSLGPLVCSGRVTISGALFSGPVTLSLAARHLECRRTRWSSTAELRLRYATVDFAHAVFEYPLTVAAEADPFVLPDGRPVAEQTLATAPDATVRMTSLHGVDAAHLVLADVDLSACLFTRTVHLDQLRLEGACSFDKVPPGTHWRRWHPVRFTQRRALAEEHHWRASQPIAVRGWNVAVFDAGNVGPAQLAPVYRALRKAFEDGKNEPGAADFYYGEMEMRRHDRTGSTRAERGLLHGYWMLSGYGLRASRALGWLAAAMLVTIVLLTGFGLPQHSPKQEATGTVPAGGGKVTFEIHQADPQNPTGKRFTSKRFERALNVTLNSVVFRSSGQDLTTAGTYIEMASRVTEPVLLGLAVLAVRNRVKR